MESSDIFLTFFDRTIPRGLHCDISTLQPWQRDSLLYLLEDASHALPVPAGVSPDLHRLVVLSSVAVWVDEHAQMKQSDREVISGAAAGLFLDEVAQYQFGIASGTAESVQVRASIAVQNTPGGFQSITGAGIEFLSPSDGPDANAGFTSADSDWWRTTASRMYELLRVVTPSNKQVIIGVFGVGAALLPYSGAESRDYSLSVKQPNAMTSPALLMLPRESGISVSTALMSGTERKLFEDDRSYWMNEIKRRKNIHTLTSPDSSITETVEAGYGRMFNEQIDPVTNSLYKYPKAFSDPFEMLISGCSGDYLTFFRAARSLHRHGRIKGVLHALRRFLVYSASTVDPKTNMDFDWWMSFWIDNGILLSSGVAVYEAFKVFQRKYGTLGAISHLTTITSLVAGLVYTLDPWGLPSGLQSHGFAPWLHSTINNVITPGAPELNYSPTLIATLRLVCSYYTVRKKLQLEAAGEYTNKSGILEIVYSFPEFVREFGRDLTTLLPFLKGNSWYQAGSRYALSTASHDLM